MSISAKVAGTELQEGLNARFGGSYLEALLINSVGTTYDPANDDAQNAAFLANEVALGAGGYQRQVIGWDASSAGAYTDDGVAMPQRYVVFEQNGSITSIAFTHFVLVWGSGNVNAGGVANGAPSSAADGSYLNLPTNTDGSGTGATVNLIVSNGGAAVGDYAIEINAPGRGYAASDTLTVSYADLVSAGVNPGSNAPVSFLISSVYSSPSAGKIVSAAKTDGQVQITNGNSAAFWVNLKKFGFYSV